MAADIELDDFVAGLEDDPDEDDADEEIADEEAADEETGFSFQPIDAQEQAGDKIPLLRREILQVSVDDYYTKLAKQEGEPQLARDPSNFEFVDGELRLKAYPSVRIINSRTKEPLALRTLYTRSGGPDIIRGRSGLGFVNWQYAAARRRLPSPIQAQFEKVVYEANAAATTDDPDSIDEFVDRVISGVDGTAGVFPTGADTVAQTTETLPPDLLPLREIQGLNESLKTIRGVKAVQESKKVSLQQLIEGYRKDIERAGTTERADQIEHEIQKAEDQLRATEDSIDALNQESRSQVRQIRDSLLRVLDKNTTLAERVRTLFREQGVTIVTILTAIGLAISTLVSTLVLALTGGGAAVAPVTPTPTPPADKAGLKEWAKKHFQALGRMLAQLAGKAAAALPGIIGSIVSWLLNLLSKTAGWLAGNLWALVVAIGGLLLIFAREWLLP